MSQGIATPSGGYGEHQFDSGLLITTVTKRGHEAVENECRDNRVWCWKEVVIYGCNQNTLYKCVIFSKNKKLP